MCDILQTQVEPQSSLLQELTGEKLLRFFFGHRTQLDPPNDIHRWVHMRGCHLMLLMALMVKYRLSPLGVEDIIEQGILLVFRMFAFFLHNRKSCKQLEQLPD